MKLTQPSLAEISAIFLYKGVYRSSSALNISGWVEPILVKFSTINQCVLTISPKAQHSISKTVATKVNLKKSLNKKKLVDMKTIISSKKHSLK
jgi:hypothetical protein